MSKDIRKALRDWVQQADYYYVGYHFGESPDGNADFESLVKVVQGLVTPPSVGAGAAPTSRIPRSEVMFTGGYWYGHITRMHQAARAAGKRYFEWNDLLYEAVETGWIGMGLVMDLVAAAEAPRPVYDTATIEGCAMALEAEKALWINEEKRDALDYAAVVVRGLATGRKGA